MTITRSRRVLLASFGVACAGVLMRAPIAEGLVTRGDDLLGAGNLDRAAIMFGRALAIEPRDSVAADRLIFTLLLRRGPGDAARGFAVATDALRASPQDGLLLADRGFSAERLARWRDAEASFATAAATAHDPRFAHLAAHMAQRAHDRTAERRHLREALLLDPHYAPARALLAKISE